MNIDLSRDILLVDNLESATLRVAGVDDVDLCDCVITTPDEWKELDPTRGQVIRQGMLFVWPYASNPRPPLGSTLIDESDNYWTILKLAHVQHVDTWEATCVNLAVEEDVELDNIATVLQATTYSKDASGEAVPVWEEVTSDIRARWQPVSEQAEIFEDADFTRTTYRVTFGALPISNPQELAGGDYRLVDKDGTRYRVVEYLTEDRIDRLPAALAVKIMEGGESAWSGA